MLSQIHFNICLKRYCYCLKREKWVELSETKFHSISLVKWMNRWRFSNLGLTENMIFLFLIISVLCVLLSGPEMSSAIKKAGFAIVTCWPKSFELGRSLPIISVVIASAETKTDWDIILGFVLFVNKTEWLKQSGFGKEVQLYTWGKRDLKSPLSQAPCKCKEHSWNETNDLTGFWWAGWCKCFTLTTLHTHNIGANSSAMNTFLCMLSFKINKQKWVI